MSDNCGAYAIRPYPAGRKIGFEGLAGITFWTRGDKYVFHFFMSNRLSDRHPCRGVLHTPLARLSSTLSPLAGRLVGRIQYAPTLPEKKRVPRAGVFHRLGQWEINTYFISSCLIGYQTGAHVGAYCIRLLHVYRLPFRPLRGVW